MKKILSSFAVGMLMFSAVPAFAMQPTDAMTHQDSMKQTTKAMHLDRACAKTAYQTRNASIKTAQVNFRATMKAANDGRHSEMMTANKDTSMLMMAKDHFKTAYQKAVADRNSAVKAAQAQFKTDWAGCKK